MVNAAMQNDMKKILILDGMWNKTLAAVRSFGNRGFQVTAGEWTRFATALFSKHCHRSVVYPSPVFSPDDFIEWLIQELRLNDYTMLLPTELSTQMLLVRNRQLIEQYTKLPFADYELTSQIQDKAWLMKFALENEIACPKTYFPLDFKDVRRLKDRIEFPAVIKPKSSSGSRGIVYVKRPSELLEAYNTVDSRYPGPIIQEFIPNGGAYGVGVLMNYSSEPRAAFTYKRLREYPVTGGPSTLRCSAINKEAEDIALSLLKSLSWTGVAMVEFRVDTRDGKPKLMEINPRFWGSLQLAIMSGVDFPYLLYRLAADGDVESVNKYEVGLKSRWLIPGDIMHFLKNPDRLKLIPDYFKADAEDDIISLDDPMPTLGRISSLFPLIFKKEMRELLS